MSAYDTIDGVVLAQVQIAAKSNEIPAFTPLLEQVAARLGSLNNLQEWARPEGHIENRLHWVRDETFREDAHTARTGAGPAVAAVLRNTAIGFHRINGEPNIARATRRANRRPHDLIDTVTTNYPTTQ